MNLSEFSRKGGKAGTGEAKKRKTSFNSATAKAALAARWAKTKRKPKRVARRSNECSYPGGLSEEQFSRWLPRARAAISKATGDDTQTPNPKP